MRIIRLTNKDKITLNIKTVAAKEEDDFGQVVKIPSFSSWDGIFIKKNFKFRNMNEKIRLIIEDCYSGNIFIAGHNKDTNQVFFVGIGRLKRHIVKSK